MAAPLLLANILAQWGRSLDQAGEPRYLYVEGINSIVDQLRHLRTSLTVAWDVATSWLEMEPSIHRHPMPALILKAMVTTAPYWGWTRMAAIMLLAFHGIFRMGDILPARREHLALPSDYGDNLMVIHLAVEAPKTRRRGARQQHGSVHDQFTINLWEWAVQGWSPSTPLWPHSANIFRRRWDSILRELRLLHLGLTPASLRGGGAVAEYRRNPDVASLQRRMRIADQKTLAHYLQEVAARNVLLQIPASDRLRLTAVANELDAFAAVFT